MTCFAGGKLFCSRCVGSYGAGNKSSEGDTRHSGVVMNSFAICASLRGSCLENGTALAHKGEEVSSSNKDCQTKGLFALVFFFIVSIKMYINHF